MAGKVEYKYGIKYRVIKLETDKYILFPVSLVKGQEEKNGLKTKYGVLTYASEKENLDNRYVVDMVYDKEELEYLYDYDDNDEEFLGEFFFNDCKDIIYFIDTDISKGFISRSEINLRVISCAGEDLTYYMNNSIPMVILNEKALNEIMKCEDIEEIRILLTKYKKLLESFRDLNKKKDITKISVVGGKISSIETSRKIINADDLKTININVNEENKNTDTNTNIDQSISYRGLKKYIKERVYGHDEEIEMFCQKLYMNITANNNEDTDSILLVGPTGVGKTETVKTACDYLQIPSIFVNASNLVPQGIKGMCIEDVLVSLYEAANGNIEKAKRGLIFLDEFDKLNASELDIKLAVKNILLTFTAGGVFPVNTDNYNFIFDSRMTNKVYAGVFQRITDKEKSLGFTERKSNVLTLEAEDIRKKIIEKDYFTLEELSRISTILSFQELTRDTKRRILLDSKISELAKKKERYKRQFGIDLIVDESYIDAILDKLSEEESGMRSVNNLVSRTISKAERSILETENSGYKKLILSKKTVLNPKEFDIL